MLFHPIRNYIYDKKRNIISNAIFLLLNQVKWTINKRYFWKKEIKNHIKHLIKEDKKTSEIKPKVENYEATLCWEAGTELWYQIYNGMLFYDIKNSDN